MPYLSAYFCNIQPDGSPMDGDAAPGVGGEGEAKEGQEEEEDVEDAALSAQREAAQSEIELYARVKRTITRVLRAKTKKNPLPVSMYRNTGTVNGYDKAAIDVVCSPLTIGAIEQTFAVEYKEVQDSYRSVDDEGNLVTRTQYFDVKVCAVS